VKYEPIDDAPSRAELAVALSTDDSTRVTKALIALSFYDEDWQWVQERCLECLINRHPWVRRTAATCLVHLARIHGKSDEHRVIRALRSAALNEDDRPYIEGAIDDIRWELSRKREV
jgi:hypothetical protein